MKTTKNIKIIVITLILIIISCVLIAVIGLNLGTEFTGGSVINYSINSDNYDSNVLQLELVDAFRAQGVEINSIQFGDNEVEVAFVVEDILRLGDILNEIKIEGLELTSQSTMTASLGKNILQNLFRVSIASFAIALIYILVVYRATLKPLKSICLGIVTTFVVVGTVSITFAIFAILSEISDFQFSMASFMSMFVMICFVIANVIIVFGKLSENLKKHRKKQIEEIIALSLKQLRRGYTFVTIFLVIILVPLFFISGVVIKSFVYVFFMGFVVEFYSSFFC